MSKVGIVYWSGTGNTKIMAEAVLEGAKNKGLEATLFDVSEFNKDMVSDFDAIAFGCPAMGAEALEEVEFEPVFSECDLNGKNIALFGSYGWGGGEWMNSWEEVCGEKGAKLVSKSVICNEAPDDEVLEECKKLGEMLG